MMYSLRLSVLRFTFKLIPVYQNMGQKSRWIQIPTHTAMDEQRATKAINENPFFKNFDYEIDGLLLDRVWISGRTK